MRAIGRLFHLSFGSFQALARTIRQRFGAALWRTYFEHPTVDYDSATKVILEGRHFAIRAAPFQSMAAARSAVRG